MPKCRQDDKKILRRADQLSNEGYNLFLNQHYHAACRKFSEALALKVNNKNLNAVLYTNRSACRSKLGQYHDASTDAIQAVILDPDYSKAWARLGTAKDLLNQPWDSMTAWQKALEVLPTDESILTEDELCEKRDYEAKLDAALVAWRDRHCSQSGDSSKSMTASSGAMPWIVAKSMIPQLEEDRTFTSSAWIVAHAHDDFELGTFEMKPESSKEEDEFARIQALRNLSDAILMDSRVFEVDDPDEWLGQFEDQAESELIGRRAWDWRDMSEDQIFEEAASRLDKEGWDGLRPALSALVRYWILRGFLDGRFKEDEYRSEARYLGRAIEVIER
ncbi:hypothetical protein V5O48_012656, partial [Marasmius crinis-equi]